MSPSDDLVVVSSAASSLDKGMSRRQPFKTLNGAPTTELKAPPPSPEALVSTPKTTPVPARDALNAVLEALMDVLLMDAVLELEDQAQPTVPTSWALCINDIISRDLSPETEDYGDIGDQDDCSVVHDPDAACDDDAPTFIFCVGCMSAQFQDNYDYVEPRSRTIFLDLDEQVNV